MGRYVLYSVVCICVTALIITGFYLTMEANKYKMELVIECIYARGDFEESVTGCLRDMEQIFNWKRE